MLLTIAYITSNNLIVENSNSTIKFDNVIGLLLITEYSKLRIEFAKKRSVFQSQVRKLLKAAWRLIHTLIG